MVNFLKNLKIKYKLTGGFGITIALFTFVMIIYQLTIQSTTSNFSNLMKLNVTISNMASNTKVLMKQCRINEKDFLTSLDKKYLDQL